MKKCLECFSENYDSMHVCISCYIELCDACYVNNLCKRCNYTETDFLIKKQRENYIRQKYSDIRSSLTIDENIVLDSLIMSLVNHDQKETRRCKNYLSKKIPIKYEEINQILRDLLLENDLI